MADQKSEQPRVACSAEPEGKVHSLLSLFNWLIGEVVTARVMTLRLASDLVRVGVLPVEELNGSPLSNEIIDSVLSHFPKEPAWRPIAQRLRLALEEVQLAEARAAAERDEDDEESPDFELADDLSEEELDALLDSEVLYEHPGDVRAPAVSVSPQRPGVQRLKN